MASADIWADFEKIRHTVKLNTVDRLKHILSGFNEQCGSNLTKSGKKQELIDRILRELDSWRQTNNSERWLKAKNILNTVRISGIYSPYRPNGESSYVASSSQSIYSSPTASTSGYTARPSGTSNIPHYDPYAPPRKPVVPPAPTVPSTSSSPGIQFKHSPFFRIERAVSSVIECPESTSQIDRKSQSLSFTISSDVATKLSSSSPKYQLRLYCTSSTYYSPPSSFRSNLGPCPIEFPPTCEVRVNNTQMNANLKGMKKKPGTAPPPDLGKLSRIANGASNRLDMVYVNSQQPAPSKKYYMVVMLVEVTTVDQLITRLRKGKYKSSSEILAKMNAAASEDDDIVAGHQKMSLKCPLSYMRIATPCRSALCVHSQCFDAFSWYSMMEQTTTWLCPVCEKALNTEELIVDGYFDEILNDTSDDVEDVIVEADGQWHTADNKFGSAAWKAAHPPIKDPTLSLPPTPIKRRSPTPVKPAINGDARPQAGPSNPEIVILDSDDEDEGQVKRELSPSVYRTANGSLGSYPPRSQTVESDVIDLTLDSDDEAPIMTTLHSKKRKSDERDLISPTEKIWKKSRLDGPASSGPNTPTSVSYAGSACETKGGPYSPPRDPTRTLPPLSPNRYSNAYSSRTYPPPYIPSGASSIPSRDPRTTNVSANSYPPSSYLSRPNGTASSSSGQWRT